MQKVEVRGKQPDSQTGIIDNSRPTSIGGGKKGQKVKEQRKLENNEDDELKRSQSPESKVTKRPSSKT